MEAAASASGAPRGEHRTRRLAQLEREQVVGQQRRLQVGKQIENTPAIRHDLAPGDGPKREGTGVTDQKGGKQFRPLAQNQQSRKQVAPVSQPPD